MGVLGDSQGNIWFVIGRAAGQQLQKNLAPARFYEVVRLFRIFSYADITLNYLELCTMKGG